MHEDRTLVYLKTHDMLMSGRTLPNSFHEAHYPDPNYLPKKRKRERERITEQSASGTLRHIRNIQKCSIKYSQIKSKTTSKRCRNGSTYKNWSR